MCVRRDLGRRAQSAQTHFFTSSPRSMRSTSLSMQEGSNRVAPCRPSPACTTTISKVVFCIVLYTQLQCHVSSQTTTAPVGRAPHHRSRSSGKKRSQHCGKRNTCIAKRSAERSARLERSYALKWSLTATKSNRMNGRYLRSTRWLRDVYPKAPVYAQQRRTRRVYRCLSCKKCLPAQQQQQQPSPPSSSITPITRFTLLLPPFLDKVVAAEQYEREDIRKRYGASIRAFEEARRCGKELVLDALRQQSLSPASPAQARLTPGSRNLVLAQPTPPKDTKKVVASWRQQTVDDAHDEDVSKNSHKPQPPQGRKASLNGPPRYSEAAPQVGDDEDEDHAVRQESSTRPVLHVPDASRMRGSSPRAQPLQNIRVHFQNIVNEEERERELLLSLHSSEMSHVVNCFASQIVHVYDWSHGVNRPRLKGRPGEAFESGRVQTSAAASTTSPPYAVLPAIHSAQPRSESPRTTSSIAIDRQNKQRHLPAFMRTPDPPVSRPAAAAVGGGSLEDVRAALSRAAGGNSSDSHGHVSRLSNLFANTARKPSNHNASATTLEPIF